MIGGLGICGRPFCCSQFLDGFLPVSIKMAKTQNLSLNPTKISGTCGRLMCCLKYEQNVYEDASRRMPKAESFVQTPDGPRQRQERGSAAGDGAGQPGQRAGAPEDLSRQRDHRAAQRQGQPGGHRRPGAARPLCGGAGRGGGAGCARPHHALLYGCPPGGGAGPGEDRRSRQRRGKIPPPAPGRPAPLRRSQADRGRTAPGARPDGRSRRTAGSARPGRRTGPPSPSRRRAAPRRRRRLPGRARPSARRRPHHRGGRRRNKGGGEGGSAPRSE